MFEKSSLAWLFLALMVGMVFHESSADVRNSTAQKKEKAELGTKDFSNESRFTGDVAFSIPLATMGGLDVMLRYNSNIYKHVATENRFSPPGWVGLGWTLSIGSIHADINNTKDPSDDKYFVVGADFTSELIPASTGGFILRDHQHWNIERTVANGTVAGWTITLEDGTVHRFGNYDLQAGTFVSDYLPTYATRFLIGWGGLVSTTSPGGTPSLICLTNGIFRTCRM